MNQNGRTNRYSTTSPRGRGQPAAGRAQYNPYSGHRPARPNQSMDKFKSVAQFTVAVIVAAIPISFYLVQPGDIHNAVASNHTSEDIKQILNTLGGNIKDKASDVFSDGRALRVKKAEPLPREDRHDDDHDHAPQNVRQNIPQRIPARTQQRIEQIIPENVNVQALDDRMEETQVELSRVEQPQPVAMPEKSNKGMLKSVGQQAAEKETAMQHAAKHADPTYICPMHPDVVTNDPKAICPICGMDLVPLETGGDAGSVKLSPTVINTLGVRTEPAKVRTLFRKINSVGYVELDESKLRTVNLRIDGWIEKLYVTSEGDRVEQGQPLFELYSPKLVNAQEEYVQALQHQNELVMKASRDRLLSLGVSEEQIDMLQSQEDVKQHVVFNAPQSGVISQHKIREGQFVKPSQALMEIVDLSSIWVIAEIFESQADWVKKGQRAKASLPYLPGESIEGMVDYVYPALDPMTRSLKVRMRFDNPEESIKPNMYADVEIYAKPKKKVLTIPREALITTGDENRVIISMGDGKFIPMKVKVGMRTDRGVEILNGLAEGDNVVTSSQFLIDSESSLKASLAKMAGGG
ncbi:efflux RND transporter periplasmic adaptor subunit [Kaarinaea lacus]